MTLGIIAALFAGAMWGITFVAARAVVPFTELELALARNLVFGGVSILLMVLPSFRPSGISVRNCLISMFLGFVGYVGIFLSISFAVNSAGASIPPLIVGLMPVILSITGNMRDRSVSWSALTMPLGLIASGICLVNIWAMKNAGAVSNVPNLYLGILSSIVALLLWILYGVINARVMEKSDAPAALPWTSLHGIGALLGSLPILALSSADRGNAVLDISLSSESNLRFLLWALVSGLGGSWIASWAWAVASRRLPLSLTAQLIVSEVCFGLAYGFAFEGRWPSVEEWAGSALMIAGVLMAIRIFKKKRDSQPIPKIATAET